MNPVFWPAYVHLAWAYERMGDRDAALRELKTALQLSPDHPEVLAALAHVHGTLGSRAEALRVVQTLRLLSQRRYVSPCHMATASLGIGAKREALSFLEKAYQERACGQSLQGLSVDPLFDVLRDEPRFQDLVRRVAAP